MSENSQPKLPFITRLKLYIVSLANHLYIRRDGTINRWIFRLIDLKASACHKKLINTTTAVSTSDITVDKSRNLWFRLFTPSAIDKNSTSHKSLPLIVYFHGGGFTTYSPDSKPFHDLCTHLAAEVPAVVVSINYRLAPEFRYPTQYEDGFDTLKYIDEQNYAVLPANTDLNKCFIAGDSAGGNIAHHITFKACNNRGELNRIKTIGLVAVQPFFGGEERVDSEVKLMKAPLLNVEKTDWMWRCFLPEGADRNHHAANFFRYSTATQELKKNAQFPKTLVIMGGYDPLQDWQKKYIQWLEDCGKQVEVIEYPDAFHGFYGFPELVEHNLLINDFANFIQKQSTL